MSFAKAAFFLSLFALALGDCSGQTSYDWPKQCTGGTQPGTRELERYFQNNWRGTSLGTYNCRTVRGGSTLSLHGEGRAVDWGLDVNNAAQKAVGDQLKAVLISKSASWGIQEVIWNRRYWARSSGDIYYNGENPHYDHLHIGLNWCGASSFNQGWASGSGGSSWGSCTVNGVGGTCKDSAQCSGTKTAGYCPGPSNIQCCTPAGAEISQLGSTQHGFFNVLGSGNAVAIGLVVAVAVLLVAVVVMGVLVRRQRQVALSNSYEELEVA